MLAVLGVATMLVAVGSGVAQSRTAAQASLDRVLTAQASANAAALREYFDRARSVDLLLAHDSVFQQFSPGRGVADDPEALVQRVASARAGSAMAYLERLYPGRISEACLVASTGTELARVVRGVVAPQEELATNESEHSFFRPTLLLPAGRVFQAAPYLSDDTDEWVISNSTPLVSPAGRAWAFVHFEVALDSFRPTVTAAAGRRGLTAGIVDTRSARLLLRSELPLVSGRLGSRISPALQGLTNRPGNASSATVDGQRVAVARVRVGPDNVNSWVVVATAPTGASRWSGSIGAGPITMALGALLLLGVAGLGLRSSHLALRKASLTDELTGLPNRRLLLDRLEQALLLARRRGTTCAVLMIDLDRFKEVNDTLGHDQGDELLKVVAERLRRTVRESDTVARIGGDEFAVLLPEVADEDAAARLAGRCQAALHETFLLAGVILGVEASFGVATAPHHASTAPALLRAADVAMYEAKGRRAGIAVYDATLDEDTPPRLALLADLRRALGNDEMFLHYQPKIELDTDALRGVEALVRWQHPSRGLVPPDEFIPIAEGTALILPLTLCTLQMAARQARLWLDGGDPVQVAVNLSPRCLLDLEFPTMVEAVLTEHRLPAKLLRLEITESTIMTDPSRALAVLAALNHLGIALSIDDFGTGYTSMSYLKRLPVDELKIDRSFVTDMLNNASDNVLVRSSVDLGHNLGFTVVAEGVEDQATADALQGLGCDAVQGFHLARPMTADALTSWLARRRDHRTVATSGVDEIRCP